MVLRIYKKNNNLLVDIIDRVNGELIQIQRYLNLIKKTKNNITEVYTEHTELLYENDDYIIVDYKIIIHPNDFFPNLKVYEYDKNIEYNEINLIVDIKQIKKIKIIQESITFLEIEFIDNFTESYSIKTLLDQIKQQILDHK